MKKVKLVLGKVLSFLVFLVLSTQKALAFELGIKQPEGTIPGSLVDIIAKISGILVSLVGVVAILFLIIGGFMYVTSQGNAERIEKAKNTILYAIIGLVVAILSYAVVKFVIESLID